MNDTNLRHTFASTNSATGLKKKPPELQNRRPKLKDQVQQRKNKIIILFLQVKTANLYHYFVK